MGALVGVVLCFLLGIYLYHIIQTKFKHANTVHTPLNVPTNTQPSMDSQNNTERPFSSVLPLPKSTISPGGQYLGVMHFQRIKFLTDKIELIYEGFEHDHSQVKDLLASGLTGSLNKSVTYEFKLRSKVKLYCADISSEQFELFIRVRTDLIAFINQLSTINKSRGLSSSSRMENSTELQPGQERLKAYQHELYAIQEVLEGNMQTLLSQITDSKD